MFKHIDNLLCLSWKEPSKYKADKWTANIPAAKELGNKKYLFFQGSLKAPA